MKLFRILEIISASMVLFSTQTMAEDASRGKIEYSNSCSACHGESGGGNGPLAELLTVKLPDLKQLAKNNGGVFPFERIYQIIDGRQHVKAHGSREMPVWGPRYEKQAEQPYASELLDQDTIELIARTRIIALIDYLYSIQEK